MHRPSPSRPPSPAVFPCKPTEWPRREGAFALLITITLLAFLVLILVGLATLTRVETQVAANNQSLAQARQNAMMALNVALGELQRTAGPDQRVTATADSLAGTHPSKAKWTGVWDAAGTGGPFVWLVSGADAQRTNAGNVGSVGGGTWVELVGDNTADSHPEDSDRNNHRVVVPTQELRAEVPGIEIGPDGKPPVIGRLAWWVGDEGVKARVNLRDAWANAAPAERGRSFTTAQRAAVENVRAADGAALGNAFPANGATVERVLHLNQLGFLGQTSAATAALTGAARSRFHDLTTHSRGVLADVRNGGLKKDLSAWTRNTSPAPGAPADPDLIFTPQDMGVAIPAAGDDYGLPTWGLVRDFARTRHGASPITPRIATNTTQGISPVLTLARVGFAIDARPGEPLRLHLFPTAVLWNPYSAPLAPGLYEFGVYHRDPSVRFSFASGVEATPGDAASTVWTPGLGELWLARGRFPDGGTAVDDFRPFVFRIRVEQPLPPGASWVFSVADEEDGAGYTAASELVRGNRPQNTLVLTGTTPVPVSAQWIRWGPGIPPPSDQPPNYVAGEGEVDAALRPVVADAPPFRGPDLSDSAYQLIQRLGHAALLGPLDQRVEATPQGVTQPAFGIGIMAKMGSTSSVNGRWIATANYRAQLAIRTAAEPDNPTYSLFIGTSGEATSPTFLSFDGDRASAGRRVNQEVPARDVVLAEILPENASLASLAQLQHANLSRFSNYPGPAVGNSHASYRLDGQDIQRPLRPTPEVLTDLPTRHYDLAYGLNRALWDRYFFSTVPDGLTSGDLSDPAHRLPNGVLRLFRPAQTSLADDLLAASAFHRAASVLLVDGAFNINSTSVEAWRAVLSAANGLRYDPRTGGEGPALSNPVSRFSRPRGDTADVWTGYRTLSDAQIDQLARNIVEQVRARGPFRSLAEFVNRRPAAAGTADYVFAVKGPLQAALDRTTSGAGAVNAATTAPFDDMGPHATPTTDDPEFFRPDLIRGNTSVTNVAPYSSLMAFAPGMVSQADLLNAIGPLIAARSDTFLIRAYGEGVNPATQTTQGRAWCEAVVQRLPDYVTADDAANRADVFPPAAQDSQRFGRRFVVVAFRWLTEDDL